MNGQDAGNVEEERRQPTRAVVALRQGAELPRIAFRNGQSATQASFIEVGDRTRRSRAPADVMAVTHPAQPKQPPHPPLGKALAQSSILGNSRKRRRWLSPSSRGPA